MDLFEALLEGQELSLGTLSIVLCIL